MRHITAPAVHYMSVSRFTENGLRQIEDFVAQEMRVALVYNGVAHTVMMATPQHLEAFALGFTLSERIVEDMSEIKDINIQKVELGVVIYIEITQRRFMALKEQHRSMAGRTGCGLCGVAQLEQAIKPVVKVPNEHAFVMDKFFPVLEKLDKLQPLFSCTGATHAAMTLSPHGEIISCFEDVGRHIALDKLIGACARDQVAPTAVLLTSRASFEMVQKAASAGIEILFAISAATALAVELAEASNITLVGFCRNGRATVYTHGHRLIAEEPKSESAQVDAVIA